MKNTMKTLSFITGIALALSLCGKAQAQADFPPSPPPEMMELFQSMTPERLENMRNMAESIDPEQREAMREKMFNMTPEQRQEMFQQLSTDPQKALKALGQDFKDPLRERMGVTNNAEWLVIEAKIAAVKKARTTLMSYGGGMTGMMGMVGMPGGFGGGRGGMLGGTSPEAQALQDALDSNAPTAQTRTLLAKFYAARKEKQAMLVKTQGDLRTVLTPIQEAILTLNGLLN
jgi:hypothetical protein